MTEKLFYANAYQKTFEATVTDCREGKKGYEVILDRSAFIRKAAVSQEILVFFSVLIRQ